ncbi:hypothetical protein C8R44DRAFT_979464 [Mycena epipterygia]|nr:hypothetical protein C8R44DRAFT_979464 [Mycena epipterygia]
MPSRWIRRQRLQPPPHLSRTNLTLSTRCKEILRQDNVRAPSPMIAPPSPPPPGPVVRTSCFAQTSCHCIDATLFHLESTLKSIAELDSLVENVLLKEDFDRAHLENFSAAQENKCLDDTAAPATDNSSAPDGWKTVSIKIKLPAAKLCISEENAAEFEVLGLIYRPLLDVMIKAFQSPAFKQFHITPFEHRWDPKHNLENPNVQLDPPDGALDENGIPVLPDGHQVMYGEIYIVQDVQGAQLSSSDSTPASRNHNRRLHVLVGFHAPRELWNRVPLAALPASIKDFYREKFGRTPSADMMAHLKRELMHGIWDLLLSPEFIHAYVHGIVVRCYDGIERLIFPRFFTYGADYPEKVLLATIKYFGGYPCPRCLIEKAQIPAMRTKADMQCNQNIREDAMWYLYIINLVWRWIFAKGRFVGGEPVNKNPKPKSWVPTRMRQCPTNADRPTAVGPDGPKAELKMLQTDTRNFIKREIKRVKQNAFSKLAAYGFSFFVMFVPDLLHEVEFGGWKSLFTHLIRILYAYDPDPVDELNRRFHCIPTFGRSTICRFHSSVSEMKKLAARDFEDILQCCIAMFEGLLPEPHNTIVLTLVSTFATWHAYAELRLHSSLTIRSFRIVTTDLGSKEESRRARRKAQKKAKSPGNTPNPAAAKSPKTRKEWNIGAYKWHSLGDYADTIGHFGTTDSYSTQIGELAHRFTKKFYVKTNKCNFERQIAAHECHQRLLHGIKQHMDETAAAAPHPLAPRMLSPPRMMCCLAHRHGNITTSLNRKDHGDESQYSIQDLVDVNIIGERLYTHKVLRINNTTYDVLRDQDTLNTRTHPDFMVVAHKDEDKFSAHPYWYRRIISIFHAEVRHVGPKSKNRSKIHHMEFVWVRWFGRDLSHHVGWKHRRLHCVGFLNASEPDSGAFDFLDPAEIIRGAHLIPAFHYGRTKDLLALSVAHHFDADKDEDYVYYYVNSFFDCDMFMCYSSDALPKVILKFSDLVSACKVHMTANRTLKATALKMCFLSATTMLTPDAATAAAATLLALANPAPGPVPAPSAAKHKYNEILDLLGAPPVVTGKRAKRDSLEMKSPLEKLLSLAKYFVRAVHPFMDIKLVLFYGFEAHWAAPVPSVSSTVPFRPKVHTM